MRLLTESLVYGNDKLYFVTRELNILFEYNIADESIKMIGPAPDEDNIVDRLFNGICLVDNKVFLAPYNAESAWAYDLNTEKWIRIDINSFVGADVKGKCVGCVGVENNVYFIGYEYSGVLRLNTESWQINKVVGLEGLNSYWGQTTAVIESNAYIASHNTNEILELDMSNGTCKKHLNLTGENKFGGIVYYNKKFYILPNSGNKLYEWDGCTYINEYTLPEKYNTYSSVFNGLAISDDYILLYSPARSKSFLLGYNGKPSVTIDDEVFFAKYIQNLGYILCKKGEISILDNNLEQKKIIPIEMSKDEFEKFISKINVKGNIYKENNIWTINEYIKVI